MNECFPQRTNISVFAKRHFLTPCLCFWGSVLFK